MVMIRCPQCGQRALDVASACPKCGHVLIQNPLETHDWGSLRECGRCGKHIDRDLAICPYCGHHVRAVRTAWRVALGTLGTALVAAALIGLWRAGVFRSLQEATRSARRPDAAAQTPVAPAIVPAAPPPSDTATVRAAPLVAVPPDSAGPDTAAARAPAPGRAAAPPSQPRDLVTRWTIEWANVRAARSLESTVVRVLPPGRAVEVREMRQGWWALHANGIVVGYIANSVLSNTPPG